MEITRIKIPEAMSFLFEKSRLKVAYGGRGGGKSESIARYLLHFMRKGVPNFNKRFCPQRFIRHNWQIQFAFIL